MDPPVGAEVFAKRIRKGTAVTMLGRPESVEPIMPLQELCYMHAYVDK